MPQTATGHEEATAVCQMQQQARHLCWPFQNVYSLPKKTFSTLASPG